MLGHAFRFLRAMRLLPPSLILLSIAPAAWAESQSALPETGSSLLQMFMGLAVVIAMIVGTLWLLKRLGMPRGPSSGLMRVVAGAAVGPRERVVILEIGTTWLVLGVAPGEVSMLAEVPRLEVPASPAGEGKDFASWLKQITERRRGAPDA
jgi:flagellar protein FliO/FliZ